MRDLPARPPAVHRARRDALLGLAALLAAGCHHAAADNGSCASVADPCLRAQVNLGSGGCTTVARPNGTACDDDNVCTTQDFCLEGVCVGRDPVICPQQDACGLPGACDALAGCAQAGLTPCVAQPPATALGGCAPSSYWVTTTVGGTQSLALLVDTGSATLAVASSLCSGCGVSPTYTPGSTAAALGENSDATYGDRSGWSGAVYTDSIAVPGAPSVSMDFVAMRSQTTFFSPNACIADRATAAGYQGILGLGSSALTTPYTDAYVDKLTASGITGNAFAVQLCDTGGNLWFGGYDPNAAAAPLQFTPLQMSSGFYGVDLTDVHLGGTSLGFSGDAYGDAVVDTGTTEIILPTAIYSKLSGLIEANAVFAQNFGDGFFDNQASCSAAAAGASRAQLDAQLPPLALVLPVAGSTATFTLTLPPTQSYLIALPTSKGTTVYCPALTSGSFTTLGAAAMRSLLTVFSPQAYQIGFAPQRGCP